MPTESYYLEIGDPRRIEVTWDGMFNNFGVKYEGQPVIVGLSRKQLRSGYECKLPDGSTLIVHTGKNILPELQVLRNGKPLPEFEHFARIRFAGLVMFIFTGIAVITGILPVIGRQNPFETPSIFGIWGAGGLLALLTFFIFRKSVVAVIIATVLCVALSIATIVNIVTTWQFAVGELLMILSPIPVAQAIMPAIALKRGNPVPPSLK